jgi:hypothetical protein
MPLIPQVLVYITFALGHPPLFSVIVKVFMESHVTSTGPYKRLNGGSQGCPCPKTPEPVNTLLYMEKRPKI